MNRWNIKLVQCLDSLTFISLLDEVTRYFYCLPILKREKHRQTLLQAATSGNPKFFLGTDSAPHIYY